MVSDTGQVLNTGLAERIWLGAGQCWGLLDYNIIAWAEQVSQPPVLQSMPCL